MRARRLYHNPRLGQGGEQGREPFQMDRGKAIADQHDHLEIRVCLRHQAGQGDGFEQAEPFLKPRGIIKVGDTISGGVMPDLKPAKRRIGKAA